jgi:hypothetical protein
MVQSTVVVAINRPISVVFAFVANAETAPQWKDEMVEVQCTTDGPIGVGTTYSAVCSRLRERITALLEITEYEPHTKVTFECLAGPSRILERYDFKSVGDGTRVTCGFELADHVRGTRHVVSAEAAILSKLKDVLESQSPAARPTGANLALDRVSKRLPHGVAGPAERGRPA